MPFTPFHFGPGAAIKAVIPAHFSFMVFCYAQVVIDLESGYYLFRGEYPVHRAFHTYAGATAVGLFCALTGRPLFQLLMRWLSSPARVAWRVAFVSSLVGTYSHVFIDSIMHGDVTPLRPFDSSNPMYQVIGADLRHLLCLMLGVVGAVLFLLVRNRRGSAGW